MQKFCLLTFISTHDSIWRVDPQPLLIVTMVPVNPQPLLIVTMVPVNPQPLLIVTMLPVNPQPLLIVTMVPVNPRLYKLALPCLLIPNFSNCHYGAC